MDRRKALKGIGLSLGYVAATPTLISLLHGCNKESGSTWQAVFFSKEETLLLKNLVNYIVPATEKIPGAIDVHVPEFLDSFFDKVVEEKDQNIFRKGLQCILEDPVAGLKDHSEENYHLFLSKYFKSNKEEREKIKMYEPENLIFETLKKLRSLTIWAYKNSAFIGENVLAYDPVPGVYLGCVSLEATTNGKAWSL